LPSTLPTSLPSVSPSVVPSNVPSSSPSYFPVYSEWTVGEVEEAVEDLLDESFDDYANFFNALENGAGSKIALASVALSKVLDFGSEDHVTQTLVTDDLLRIADLMMSLMKSVDEAFDHLAEPFFQDDSELIRETMSRTAALSTEFFNFVTSIATVPEKQARKNYVEKFR
jgi:hypothetical protein